MNWKQMASGLGHNRESFTNAKLTEPHLSSLKLETSNLAPGVGMLGRSSCEQPCQLAFGKSHLIYPRLSVTACDHSRFSTPGLPSQLDVTSSTAPVLSRRACPRRSTTTGSSHTYIPGPWPCSVPSRRAFWGESGRFRGVTFSFNCIVLYLVKRMHTIACLPDTRPF